MTEIRIHCVIDDILKNRQTEIKFAMDKAWQVYKIGSGLKLEVQYDIEYRSLSSVPWEFYQVYEDNGVLVKDKYMGFGFNWINQDTKKIWDKSGWAYDCVVYIVAPQNWHTEYAWGWNVGGFYNNYQIEIVKAIENNNLWMGFAMEVFHAMDDFVFAELGKNLEDTLGVQDFDRDVVHGIKDPPFKVFEYQYPISIMYQQLIDTFEKRAQKYLASLLSLYISLLRQYIAYLMKPKPTPFLPLGESHIGHFH